MIRSVLCIGVLFVSSVVLSGCGQPSASVPPTSPGAAASGTKADESPGTSGDETKPKRKSLKPVELSGTGSAGEGSAADAAPKIESVRAALKPLQILIGDWNGTSRKASLDEPNWAWDLKTNPKQPALRIKSEKGLYIREGRLTFLPASQQFDFTATDGDGKQRVFQGGFSEEVQDVPGDDKKLQRTYKLKLTEPAADSTGEQWELVINQQENNRYMLEVYRKRGSGQFLRVDTVNTQREGTSFALSDTDYGEKTCIISQGLGTISVSYKGKSYWVCCTGCKAAFEDEPERWIAKFEAMQKEKGMK